MCVCVCVFVRACVGACVRARAYVRARERACVCACLRACVRACVCVCVHDCAAGECKCVLARTLAVQSLTSFSPLCQFHSPRVCTVHTHGDEQTGLRVGPMHPFLFIIRDVRYPSLKGQHC